MDNTSSNDSIDPQFLYRSIYSLSEAILHLMLSQSHQLRHDLPETWPFDRVHSSSFQNSQQSTCEFLDYVVRFQVPQLLEIYAYFLSTGSLPKDRADNYYEHLEKTRMRWMLSSAQSSTFEQEISFLHEFFDDKRCRTVADFGGGTGAYALALHSGFTDAGAVYVIDNHIRAEEVATPAILLRAGYLPFYPFSDILIARNVANSMLVSEYRDMLGLLIRELNPRFVVISENLPTRAPKFDMHETDRWRAITAWLLRGSTLTDDETLSRVLEEVDLTELHTFQIEERKLRVLARVKG